MDRPLRASVCLRVRFHRALLSQTPPLPPICSPHDVNDLSTPFPFKTAPTPMFAP